MKHLNGPITMCGLLSAATGVLFLSASCATFHPSIQATANRVLASVFGLWSVLTLVTAGLSLWAVPSAADGQSKAGRALRRRGLWISAPQLALVFLIAINALVSR